MLRRCLADAFTAADASSVEATDLPGDALELRSLGKVTGDCMDVGFFLVVISNSDSIG